MRWLPTTFFEWMLMILFMNVACIFGLIAYHNWRSKRNTFSIIWDTSYRVHGVPTYRWKTMPSGWGDVNPQSHREVRLDPTTIRLPRQ